MANKYNDLLSSVSSVLGQRQPGNPRQMLGHLASAGLIKHSNDRQGLAQLMQVLPGNFPRTAIPGDAEIEAWFDWSADNLPQLGPTLPIGASGNQRTARGDDDTHTWYGLGQESTPAPAVITSDTLNVTDIGGSYEDAVLFINTDQGKVRRITAVTVDEEPIFLGTGGFVDAPLVDIELLGDGSACGLFLGTIEDEVSITYEVSASATDVIMRASIFACGRSKSAQRRQVVPHKLRRQMLAIG